MPIFIRLGYQSKMAKARNSWLREAARIVAGPRRQAIKPWQPHKEIARPRKWRRHRHITIEWARHGENLNNIIGSEIIETQCVMLSKRPVAGVLVISGNRSSAQ